MEKPGPWDALQEKIDKLNNNILELLAINENGQAAVGDKRGAQPRTKERIKKKFYATKEKRKKVKSKLCEMLKEVKEKEKCAPRRDQILRECASNYYDNLRIF